MYERGDIKASFETVEMGSLEVVREVKGMGQTIG